MLPREHGILTKLTTFKYALFKKNKKTETKILENYDISKIFCWRLVVSL